MSPANKQTSLDDVQFGRLLQQVDNLVDNVEIHTTKFEDVLQRVVVLETHNKTPVVTHGDIAHINDRLTTLENVEVTIGASKDYINKIDNRITAIETRGKTSSENWALLISIIAAIAAIAALFMR